MTDLLRLREPCKHGWYMAHWISDEGTDSCPGGREVVLLKISKTHARSAVSEDQADSVYVEVTDDE